MLVVVAAAGLAARLTAAMGLLAALLLTLPSVLPTLSALSALSAAGLSARLLVGLTAASLALIAGPLVAGGLVALRHAVGIALRGVAVGHEIVSCSVERLRAA
jgi:hypothetical protein